MSELALPQSPNRLASFYKRNRRRIGRTTISLLVAAPLTAGCSSDDSEPVGVAQDTGQPEAPMPSGINTQAETTSPYVSDLNPEGIEPNNEEAICAGSPDISALNLGANQVVVDGRCDDNAPDAPVGIYAQPHQTGSSNRSANTGEILTVDCKVVDGQPRANSQESSTPEWLLVRDGYIPEVWVRGPGERNGEACER